MKAMANEPAKRYSSATQMLQDMDEFRKDPAILFDYNIPPLDAVTRMPKEPQVIPMPAGNTTAERVANRGQTPRTSSTAARSGDSRRSTSSSGTSAKSSTSSRSNTSAKSSTSSRSSSSGRTSTSKGDEKNWVAIIAVIVCALALVVAIVFLLLSCQGQDPEVPAMIEVPAVVGEYYDDLSTKYPDMKFILERKQFDEEKPAGMILEQDPVSGTQIQAGQEIAVIISDGPAPAVITMPNLQNYKEQTALDYLNSLELELNLTIDRQTSDDVESGYVISTDPEANVVLEKGTKVTVVISTGQEIKTASMPDLINATKSNAEKTLDNQKLDLDVQIEEEYDSSVEKGNVIRTEPEVGEKIKTGDKVTLYISKGPEMKLMPNLLNMDISSAYNVLSTAGFVKTPEIDYDYSDTVEKDRVMWQSEEANTELDVNTQIKLTISKGPQPPVTTTQTITIAITPPTGLEAGATYDADLMTGGETVQIITLNAEQTSVTVTVTGTGTAVLYELYYDGNVIGRKSVNFSANG